jgi:8-hydroxy-5-deazaflavin:NADPH oxidoreductase
MKIGVLGTGDVGKSLAKAFLALGHDVKMGARSAGNEKAQAFAKEAGEKASAGTFAEAAAFGEVVLLCTLGMANQEALQAAGLDNLRGKLLIDTTNPLDFSGGKPGLGITGADSAGERVQKLVPGARVVKAFNTVGNTLMFRPQLPGGPPDMFICGNDAEAKKQTAGILKDFGWDVIDLGGIESSRYLEAMCIVWVQAAMKLGTWNLAFKMLRK